MHNLFLVDMQFFLQYCWSKSVTRLSVLDDVDVLEQKQLDVFLFPIVTCGVPDV